MRAGAPRAGWPSRRSLLTARSVATGQWSRRGWRPPVHQTPAPAASHFPGAIPFAFRPVVIVLSCQRGSEGRGTPVGGMPLLQLFGRTP